MNSEYLPWREMDNGKQSYVGGSECWRRKPSLHTWVNTAVVAGWSPCRKERASQLPDSWGFSVSCLALSCTSVCAWYQRIRAPQGGQSAESNTQCVDS